MGTDEVMPKSAKMPRLRGRPKVRIKFGTPLDLSRYEGKERDRMALRSVADEIMFEIMQLSGQEYVNEYASRTPSVPTPESQRLPGEDIDLSEEILAG
jgi:1-acyl-sn-glycerol-3-phosphate acyltransferase